MKNKETKAIGTQNKYAIGYLEPECYLMFVIDKAFDRAAKHIGIQYIGRADSKYIVPNADDGIVYGNTYNWDAKEQNKDVCIVTHTFWLDVFNPIVMKKVVFSIYANLELAVDDSVEKVKSFTDKFLEEWKKLHNEFHEEAAARTIGFEEYEKVIIQPERKMKQVYFDLLSL